VRLDHIIKFILNSSHLCWKLLPAYKQGSGEQRVGKREREEE